MNTINFDELKSRIQACDPNQVDQKIILCFKSIRPALSFEIFKHLMNNALELAYIPLVRILFKLGLNYDCSPLGLDEHGNIIILQQAHIEDSLNGRHAHAFRFLSKSSDGAILQWLYEQRQFITVLSEYEVGKQALKHNDYRLIKIIAKNAHDLEIKQSFMFNLLTCSHSHKILYHAPELLDVLPQDVLNCIFNISGQSYVLIEYLASTEYGRKLLYLNDHQLTKSFLPHGLALHAECKYFGWVPIFFKLLYSEEGFDLLCFDNFFWLRHLSDEHFDEIFYNLLEVKDFDIVQFANDHPMFLLMLALFPGGRAWLGLPEDVEGDPLEQYLNMPIKEGYFMHQSISWWLASHPRGIKLIESLYIDSLVLTSEIKFKLARLGDKGKQLLVKAAKNGQQRDLTSILSMFCFYEQKAETVSPDPAMGNDLK